MKNNTTTKGNNMSKIGKRSFIKLEDSGFWIQWSQTDGQYFCELLDVNRQPTGFQESGYMIVQCIEKLEKNINLLEE